MDLLHNYFASRDNYCIDSSQKAMAILVAALIIGGYLTTSSW
jgi:hypothetical protein